MTARYLPVLAILGLLFAAGDLAAQPADVDLSLARAVELERSGDIAAARDAYDRALQAASPESAGRARALLGLATIDTAQGKYADASRRAGEAGAIFDRLGDSAQASLAWNRQGLAALNGGDYTGAEQRFRQAIERSRKAAFVEGQTEQLGNLANVYFFLGRYADAGRLYQEALKITNAAGDAPWVARRRLLLLTNEATLFQRLGRDQEALDVYRQLGTGSELRPREQAQLLVNLGVLYRRLGDPIKTLAMYDEARTLFARDQDVDGELNTIKNRGIVLALDLQRLDDAERSFTLAFETAARVGNRREMLHARLYRGEAALRAGHIEAARADFAAALPLARELKTPEEEWKALFGSGRVLDDLAERASSLRQAIDIIDHIREAIRVPSLRTEFLNDKREVFDALLAAIVPAANPADVFGVLERSHSRAWRDRLKLEREVTLADVQRELPEGTLLLDYWHSAAGAAVVAVTRERAGVFPLAVDERAIAAFADQLSAGPSSSWRGQGEALGAALLPPQEWLDRARRVVIVTDGALALVPFDALGVGGRLMVERAPLSYVPTAATFMLATSRPRWLAPWEPQIEAFAAGPTGEEQETSEGEGAALPAAAGEARAVAGQLGGHARIYIGAANRKSYLADGAGHAPMLHLATHAVADTSALEQSRIEFTGGPAGGTPEYLFLKEAYALRLDGVELAVLSACDTARGRMVRGEGIQSFSRAFLAAGARTTVTAMWRVADRPTADFMEVFYHHLGRGVARDEALRRAKLRLLHDGSALSDAHYWSAFVLTGEGDAPVPRAVTWNMVWLSAAAITIAFAATILLTRRKIPVPR